MAPFRYPRYVVVVQQDDGQVEAFGPYFDRVLALEARNELQSMDGRYSGAWTVLLNPPDFLSTIH